MLPQSNRTSLALTPSKFVPSIKSQKNRIGILRREGISPSLESARTPTVPKISKITNLKLKTNSGPSPARLMHNKASLQIASSPNKFELKVPETIPLTSSILDAHRESFQGQNKDSFEENIQLNIVTSKKEIPFWLRPTPVQPYPYNFIMAVRKKLESITHPIFSTKQPHQLSLESVSYQSPVARPQTKFASQFRQNFHQNTSESDSEIIEPRNASVQHTDEHIEYSMDFSSVTLQSNHNTSKIKSKSPQKSVRASQDTLSISSGILSHSSPEKRTKTTTSNIQSAPNSVQERHPSPLTTDNVDGLQITSSSHFETISSQIGDTNAQSGQSAERRSVHDHSIVSHINFHRGKDYDEHNQPNRQKLTKQQHVEDLLKDFTTSLSQAIEVNNRLHTILSNPPSNHKYSDDFENPATDHTSNVISEHITGNNTSIPSYNRNASYNSPSEHSTETRIDVTTQQNSTHISSSNRTSSQNKISEDFDEIISTEKDILSSTRNEHKQHPNSIGLYDGPQNESQTEIQMSLEKRSSSIVEEQIDDNQSSESPTNNDLKSMTLSIAKKSAATSDDTDQPSNTIHSFKKHIINEPDVENESIGSDIFNIFNKTSMNLRDEGNTSHWSEHSYSMLGAVSSLEFSIDFHSKN